MKKRKMKKQNVITILIIVIWYNFCNAMQKKFPNYDFIGRKRSSRDVPENQIFMTTFHFFLTDLLIYKVMKISG